jgi:two-component system, OmpR family, sensor histidine kinase KdpD
MTSPEMMSARRRRGLSAPLALPAGFGALLLLGAIAAGTHGGVDAGWVLMLAGGIVLAGSLIAEPAVAPLLAAIGWLTVVGFSRPPYAQLRPTGPLAWHAALVLLACGAAGAGAGVIVRKLASGVTLWIVDVGDERHGADDPWAAQPEPHLGEQGRSAPLTGVPDTGRPDAGGPDAGGPDAGGPGHDGLDHRGPGDGGTPRRRVPDLSGGIGARRLLAGVILVAGLPLLTLALVSRQHHLSLADDLLIYLVAVIAVAVVGGFWPAVLAAVTASLLLNWYFTDPVHTLTIADPQNLLALLLFITVAVTVSSVVHLAAHRAQQAARSAEDAAQLLALAQTVLGGADTPAAVLAHLTASCGGSAELLEQVSGQWIRVASSGTWPAATGRDRDPKITRVEARADLTLVVTGQSRPVTARLLAGFAAQTAAALDRDRLRTQAAQSEALAEGNRMRTALLAAVSHDLRTPLASIKASVSTLRQTDVEWAPADQAALLATIEQSADRLDALIGNLLDMSRLTAGSLQPFLRPTAIDEVAPVALRGLDAGGRVQLMVPDGLPLIRTDPGLLERVLANLFANALAYSPADRPPELHARPEGSSIVLEVVDHGRGVPDELKQRMFEPFQRLDARNASAALGTGAGGVGLGLAVVQGFLDAMGGSVQAADTPGGGLTMRVRLPAGSASANSASVAADQ